MVQLKRWLSHKVVSAARILSVTAEGDSVVLHLDPEHVRDGYPRVSVPVTWPPFLNNGSLLHGFFVLYADGYESWSPADPFESGYVDMDPSAPAETHPAVAHVLKFFEFGHLPPKLQEVSQPFAALAHKCVARAPCSQETTVALRKLLEAKDAAVRASL